MINHHSLFTAISKQAILRTSTTNCKWKFPLNSGCQKDWGSYQLSSWKGHEKSLKVCRIQTISIRGKKKILEGRGSKEKKIRFKSVIKYFIMKNHEHQNGSSLVGRTRTGQRPSHRDAAPVLETEIFKSLNNVSVPTSFSN